MGSKNSTKISNTNQNIHRHRHTLSVASMLASAFNKRSTMSIFPKRQALWSTVRCNSSVSSTVASGSNKSCAKSVALVPAWRASWRDFDFDMTAQDSSTRDFWSLISKRDSRLINKYGDKIQVAKNDNRYRVQAGKTKNSEAKYRLNERQFLRGPCDVMCSTLQQKGKGKGKGGKKQWRSYFQRRVEWMIYTNNQNQN